MRLRPVMFALLPVVLIGVTVGCTKTPPAHEKTSDKPAAAAPVNTDVGSPLYAPTAPPTYPSVIGRSEPIVIANATTQFEQRQIVSAEVDGVIDVIATPYLPGETPDPSQTVYLTQDTKRERPLRRISDGEEVKDGQFLAGLDAQQVTAKLAGAKEIMAAADVAREGATKGAAAAKKRLDLIEKTGVSGVGSAKELLDEQLTYFRFVENEAQAKQTIARAKQDATEAELMFTRHQVRSRVNGIVRTISRRPGEYVKASEKLMEIESNDRVRIEGQLDVQYFNKVKRGMTVKVETAVPSAPLASHNGHRQPVTGVAVTSVSLGNDGVVPLVISVGADGGALVWEPNLGEAPNRPTVPHNLPHPVGVRSVAVAPATAKAALVITGADDGKIRVWDVSNPARLPTTPKAEPEDAHTSAVQSIAVSPNGQFFATAAGRDVYVWDLATAKRRYVLPTEHRDIVTAVSFTPQNTLITASKDGSLKVWKLGTERAAVIRTIDHRAGSVEALGVSGDGGRVLFDQDKTRIDLVDPANGQTVGQIQNVSSAGSFATLAVFGPDEVPPGTPADKVPPYAIATAGGDGDLKGALQYWYAPRTGGRGAEVGRLITPGRAAVTAAAFSPVRNQPFVVVGTAAGGVHLWKPEAEVRQAHVGKIVNIDATDTRYVTVRVEADNKVLKLRDKEPATIIITPTKP